MCLVHMLMINFTVNGEKKSQEFSPMCGNYIIGRLEDRCKKIGINLLDNFPVTIIALPKADKYMSGFHAVICQESDTNENRRFSILDGWGTRKSKNGIFLNHLARPVSYAKLNHGDRVYLGCQSVYINYTCLNEQTDGEETLY